MRDAMRRFAPLVLVLAGACGDDPSTSPESARLGGEPAPREPGASGSSSGSPNPDAPPGPNGQPRIPYVPRDVNHILFTGQSNSVANAAKPVLSTTQPYQNLMFSSGVMPASGCDGAGCRRYDKPSSLVPLVEGDTFFYPVETPSAGMANQITSMKNEHRVLVTLHGRSGNTYWCLRKGGCNYKPGYISPFEQAMDEVRDAKALTAAANQSYVVRAAATVHGESDHYSYTLGLDEFPLDGTNGEPKAITSYADALIEWQADYESSVRAILGQTEAVPLFVTQISGWNDTRYSKVAQFQLDAHVRAPGKVILVGPAYPIEIASDCRHFTSHGERRLGEYIAKAYARTIIDGIPWEPVRPKDVKRAGATVTVTFHVPAPPLVLDTERVVQAASYGFDYEEAGGPVPITNVAISGPDKVTITLARAAAGRLTYAQNQVPQTCIGSEAGARGNLRDSDATPSKSGYDLHNWAVHFDVAVP
jgi:hypothetical protein